MTAILFDLDGTVADSLSNIIETTVLTLAEIDKPQDEDLVRSLIGIPLAQSAEILAGKDQAQLFLDTYHKYFLKTKDRKYEPYPGLGELIKELRDKGFKLAVVTAKLYPGTVLALEDMGLDKAFHALVTASDECEPKPSPQPALLALEKLGEKAENAYFIGDSLFDIRSGKSAGATTIGVTWGAATRGLLAKEGADYIVDNGEELRDILLKNSLKEGF